MFEALCEMPRPSLTSQSSLMSLDMRASDRDAEGKVASLACGFCERFGREEKVGSKRKRTQRAKHFVAPFTANHADA